MAQFTQFPIISKKYQSALTIVAELHKYQIRKDGTTPYLAHLLSVSSLLMEMNCTEDCAITGLFHDSLEDLENPSEIAELIKSKFGKYVLEIVQGVTEPDLPTHERKELYIRQIQDSPLEIIYVSFADKWHNWIHGYARQPQLVKKPVIDFYQRLIPIFDQRLYSPTSQFYFAQLIQSFQPIADSFDS